MPTGAIILFAAVFAIALAVATTVILSDRKRRNSKSGAEFDWIVNGGSGVTCIKVVGPLAGGATEAVNIAERAISNVGGVNLEIVGNVVVGWSPVPVLGLGWAPQQIVVKLEPDEDISSAFKCCCRPRFGTAIYDAGQSRRLAERLAQEIRSLLQW
ncbi:MAG TPA: hypothetical protein VGZ68_11185 [Acidimicrobiales bacterium]|nr:hypothetical protein [Acidimicrobiales bacterium]